MADREALVRKWFDHLGARDFDALASMYAEDAVYVRPDGKSRGRTEILQYLREIAAAFPDETATIKSVLVAPEAVTVEWRESATHLAPRTTPMGVIPPTGKGFQGAAIATTFRFDGDQITSQAEYYDLFSMMVQLGWLEFFARTFASSA